MTESGIMTYEEIKKFAEEGRECQMLVQDKWVTLDLKAVIHEFRLAPSLSPTRHDGRRVLRAALYAIATQLEQMGGYLSFRMPKSGPKTPWMVTGEVTHPGLTRKLLKDLFKTYFRISEECSDGKPPYYSVLMRPVDGYGWVRCFTVEYLEYDGFDQYERRQYCQPYPGTHDWGIKLHGFGWTKMSECGITYEMQLSNRTITVNAFLRRHKYVDARDKIESDVIVYEQRVPTLDNIEFPAPDVCYNISLKMYDMLRVISSIDMKAKEIKDFISKQLKEATRPTYYISTVQGPNTGRDISIGHLKEGVVDQLMEYLTAVYGNGAYEKIHFHKLARGFFLRYLNDKYDGTIDYVLVHP